MSSRLKLSGIAIAVQQRDNTPAVTCLGILGDSGRAVHLKCRKAKVPSLVGEGIFLFTSRSYARIPHASGEIKVNFLQIPIAQTSASRPLKRVGRLKALMA